MCGHAVVSCTAFGASGECVGRKGSRYSVHVSSSLPLRCNSVHAATGFAYSRMAVWYYNFFRLGVNLVTVGLDISYAFNAITRPSHDPKDMPGHES